MPRRNGARHSGRHRVARRKNSARKGAGSTRDAGSGHARTARAPAPGRRNRQRPRGARTAHPPHPGTRPAAAGRGARRRAAQRSGTRARRASPHALFEGLIHTLTPDERSWNLAPLVLAFAVRALVALTGDFVLHPDEIMQ